MTIFDAGAESVIYIYNFQTGSPLYNFIRQLTKNIFHKQPATSQQGFHLKRRGSGGVKEEGMVLKEQVVLLW